MAIKAVICPRCGGNVDLDDGKAFGFCVHCGTKIVLTQDIINNTVNNSYNTMQHITKNIYGGKDLKETSELIADGEEFLKLGAFEQANKVFKKATEADPKNWRAWFGYAKSGGSRSKHSEDGEVYYECKVFVAFKSAFLQADEMGKAEVALFIFEELLPLEVGFRENDEVYFEAEDFFNTLQYALDYYDKLPQPDKRMTEAACKTFNEKFRDIMWHKDAARKDDRYYKLILKLADEPLMAKMTGVLVNVYSTQKRQELLGYLEQAYKLCSEKDKADILRELGRHVCNDSVIPFMEKLAPNSFIVEYYKVRKFVCLGDIYFDSKTAKQCAEYVKRAFGLANGQEKAELYNYFALFKQGKELNLSNREVSLDERKSHSWFDKETKEAFLNFLKPSFKAIEKLMKRYRKGK